MATMRVTVDGKVLMDGDLGSWTEEPPSVTSLKLKAARRDEPWARHILLVMGEVAMTERNTTVAVSTHIDGFKLEVTH